MFTLFEFLNSSQSSGAISLQLWLHHVDQNSVDHDELASLDLHSSKKREF